MDIWCGSIFVCFCIKVVCQIATLIALFFLDIISSCPVMDGWWAFPFVSPKRSFPALNLVIWVLNVQTTFITFPQSKLLQYSVLYEGSLLSVSFVLWEKLFPAIGVVCYVSFLSWRLLPCLPPVQCPVFPEDYFPAFLRGRLDIGVIWPQTRTHQRKYLHGCCQGGLQMPAIGISTTTNSQYQYNKFNKMQIWEHPNFYMQLFQMKL